MSTKKATKRALLTSILAICMCLVMLIGSTFAWFTDTASTGVNQIKSGTLDVEIVTSDGENSLTWQKANDAEEDVLWEPGCTYLTQGFQIKNAGDLALKFKMAVTGVTGDADLLKVIKFDVVTTQDKDVAGEDLASFIGHLLPEAVAPAKEGDADQYYYIRGHMDENAGNDYMAKELEGIAITVIATQDTVENDSFNNKYDEAAPLDFEPVTSVDEFKAAIDAGKNVKLMDDLSVTADQISSATYPTTANGVTTNHPAITQDVMIDLNEKTLTYTDNNTIYVTENANFTLTNGTFEVTGISGTTAAIQSIAGTTTTLNGVTARTNGSFLFPWDNAAAVNVINSKITAGVYGVATNASGDTSKAIKINISNSTIETTTSDSDNTAVLINVDSTLTISNSTIIGQRQGVVVRAGTATITNSLIKTTGEFNNDKTYLTGNWGSGNELPCGALVVGNRSNAYPHDAVCNLIGTTLEAGNGVRTAYVYGMNYAATLTYDSASNVGTVVKDGTATVNGN